MISGFLTLNIYSSCLACQFRLCQIKMAPKRPRAQTTAMPVDRPRTRSKVADLRSFFRFPREIRDMIYGFVFTSGNNIMPTIIYCLFITEPINISKDFKLDCSILRTSKAIDLEANEYIVSHIPILFKEISGY